MRLPSMRVVVVGDAEPLSARAPALGGDADRATTQPPAGSAAASLVSWHELLTAADGAPPRARPRAPRPHDVCSLVYTSGTTGLPKGVCLTNWNVLHNLLSGWQIGCVQPGERTASFLPWSHAFGATFDLHFMLSHGAHINLISQVAQLAAEAQVRRRGVRCPAEAHAQLAVEAHPAAWRARAVREARAVWFARSPLPRVRAVATPHAGDPAARLTRRAACVECAARQGERSNGRIAAQARALPEGAGARAQPAAPVRLRLVRCATRHARRQGAKCETAAAVPVGAHREGARRSSTRRARRAALRHLLPLPSLPRRLPFPAVVRSFGFSCSTRSSGAECARHSAAASGCASPEPRHSRQWCSTLCARWA